MQTSATRPAENRLSYRAPVLENWSVPGTPRSPFAEDNHMKPPRHEEQHIQLISQAIEEASRLVNPHQA